MLEAREISAGYGIVPVIRNISLTVDNGDILVLLGRNGVGKTTLLKSLIGLLKPSSGKILIDGLDVTEWAPSRIAKAGVAYVPQGRGIFPKLTVEENLRVGLRGRKDRSSTIPDDVLAMFPILKERMNQLGGTLSGGQQQILALARALCSDPSLLLLDEPSEGIQPSIIQQISELLQTFSHELDLTILLVEQNLELVRTTATRCFVMEKGCISRELTTDELEDDQKVFEALAL